MCSSECVVALVSVAALVVLIAFAVGVTYTVATRAARRAMMKSQMPAYDPLLIIPHTEGGGGGQARHVDEELGGVGGVHAQPLNHAAGDLSFSNMGVGAGAAARSVVDMSPLALTSIPPPPLGLTKTNAAMAAIHRGVGLPEVLITVKSDKNLQTLKVDEKLLGLKPRPYNKAWDSGVFINPVAGKLAAKAHCPPGLLLSINGIPITHHSQIRKLILPSSAPGGAASEDLELLVRPTAVIKDGLITYYVQLHDPNESPGLELKFVEEKDAPSRVVVTKVLPDTPCDFFGVKPGSYVTALNDTPVRTKDTVVRLLQTARAERASMLKITVVEPDANSDEVFLNKHEEEEDNALKPTVVRLEVGAAATAGGCGFICEEHEIQHSEYEKVITQAVWPSAGSPLDVAGVPKGAVIHRIGGALISEIEHVGPAVRRAGEGAGHIILEYFPAEAFAEELSLPEHSHAPPPPAVPYDKYKVYTDFAHHEKLRHGFSPGFLKGLPGGAVLASQQPPGVVLPVPPNAKVSASCKLPLKKHVPKVQMHQNPAVYTPGMTPVKEPMVIETVTIEAPKERSPPVEPSPPARWAHSFGAPAAAGEPAGRDDDSTFDGGLSNSENSDGVGGGGGAPHSPGAPGGAAAGTHVTFAQRLSEAPAGVAAGGPAVPGGEANSIVGPCCAGGDDPASPGAAPSVSGTASTVRDRRGSLAAPKKGDVDVVAGDWVPKRGMWVRTRLKGASVRYTDGQKQRAGMKALIADIHTHTKRGGEITYVQLVFPTKGSLTWRWEDCTCVRHTLTEASVLVPVTCSKCDKTIWSIGPNQSYACAVCGNRYHKSCGQAVVQKGAGVHVSALRTAKGEEEEDAPKPTSRAGGGDAEEAHARHLVLNWDNDDKVQAVNKIGGRMAWKEMTWAERLDVIQKVQSGEEVEARRLKTLEYDKMIRTSL